MHPIVPWKVHTACDGWKSHILRIDSNGLQVPSGWWYRVLAIVGPMRVWEAKNPHEFLGRKFLYHEDPRTYPASRGLPKDWTTMARQAPEECICGSKVVSIVNGMCLLCLAASE